MYLSPKVVRALVEDAEGHCRAEGRSRAGGLAICKGWNQRLCLHGDKVAGGSGRGGSRCAGGEGAQRVGVPGDPQNMKIQGGEKLAGRGGG